MRGGLWSTAGKQTEGPLMITLCKLYSIDEKYYAIKPKAKKIKKGEINREVDFFLLKGNREYKCEVKLMGKGNPESADAVIARSSSIFIADKLSDQNKSQLTKLGVEWVELRDIQGFERFKYVLENLKIPHKHLNNRNIDTQVDAILKEVFK